MFEQESKKSAKAAVIKYKIFMITKIVDGTDELFITFQWV